MKRPVCPQCKRPTTTCICHWVTPIANSHEVLILQHPLETNHAKGSAMLLSLSLKQCRVVVGETFEPQLLEELLHAPWATETQHTPVTPVLLYPSMLPNPVVSNSFGLRLIVLDATWRKSRKMLYLNPMLAQMPRFALTKLAASRYVIRKAQRTEQRSTLEATCAALATLENGVNSKYEPLLQAFDGFVGSRRL